MSDQTTVALANLSLADATPVADETTVRVTIAEVDDQPILDQATIVSERTATRVVGSATAGPRGPQGPAGAMGPEDVSYLHVQQVASAVWEIEHPLGYYPNVTVIDSAERVVYGDVEYPTMNSIRITFTSGGFSGRAILS